MDDLELTGPALDEYLKGLKPGERVVETGRSCLQGREGTVYLGSRDEVCVMWDTKPGEGGRMGTSVTGGARRVAAAASADPTPFEEEFPEAAAVMQERYAARKPLFQVVSQPAPGRNDPCPCGSGTKYKKCCAGSLQEQAGRLIARTNHVAEADFLKIQAATDAILSQTKHERP